MPYSSNISDLEGSVLEPFFLLLLPAKKQTRPLKWAYRAILKGIFYPLKNGCSWGDLPKDFPPYSTVYWHYKQWKASGLINKLMDKRHEQVRQQVKKIQSGPS